MYSFNIEYGFVVVVIIISFALVLVYEFVNEDYVAVVWISVRNRGWLFTGGVYATVLFQVQQTCVWIEVDPI